jgi:hypothetical protein
LLPGTNFSEILCQTISQIGNVRAAHLALQYDYDSHVETRGPASSKRVGP